jgi:hypothetical protein
MKRLIIAALLLAGIALPACAQHGGAHGGGGFGGSHGGGFSSHSAPAFRSSPSFRPSSPSGGFRSSAPYNSAPRYSGNRSFAANRGFATRAPGSFARPAYRTSGPYRDDHFRRPYRSPYGYGYGAAPWVYAPWFIPDDLDDASFYDNSDNYDNGSDVPPSNYVTPYYPPDSYDQQPYPPQYQQDQSAPRPSYQPSPAASQPSAAPIPQSTVTLVFKDGRPSEQIHNYLLSRDSISVWDQHPRVIPIDQLDLDATEKANRDAGVDFHLPGTANTPATSRPAHPTAGQQPDPPPMHVAI